MKLTTDNPMTETEFDWVVSNHAMWGVEGSSKSICVRRFSPSALSLFRFHLSPFPPETPDTQAKLEAAPILIVFWVPNGVYELPEVRFKFPFSLIDRSTMVFLDRPIMARTKILVHN